MGLLLLCNNNNKGREGDVYVCVGVDMFSLYGTYLLGLPL
jgi:hypothetical protein